MTLMRSVCNFKAMQIASEFIYPQTAVIMSGSIGSAHQGLADGAGALAAVDHRSLIEIQLEWLASQDIKTVFLLLNSGADTIKSVLGNGQKWNLKIDYILGSESIGTAGSLAQLKGRIKEDFFVIYDDLYFKFFRFKIHVSGSCSETSRFDFVNPSVCAPL